MINIWDYKDSKNVRIETNNRDIHVGLVASVEDYEDLYDEDDPEYGDDNNDQITILTGDKQYLGFKQRDIKVITDLIELPLQQAVG